MAPIEMTAIKALHAALLNVNANTPSSVFDPSSLQDLHAKAMLQHKEDLIHLAPQQYSYSRQHSWDDLDVGAKVGIFIGALVLVVVVFVLIRIFCYKKCYAGRGKF
ncbi:hypothetical protein HDU97_003407 [Phlyctochytrium planicorne]|nr:hypothetical protein HDU97_003407 [Phlyctochytrium planicorne]